MDKGKVLIWVHGWGLVDADKGLARYPSDATQFDSLDEAREYVEGQLSRECSCTFLVAIDHNK